MTAPATFRFRCSRCHEWHESAPSVGFDEPHHYGVLSASSRRNFATLDSDFCIINHPDSERPDFFVRCLLEVPIRNSAEPFLWGVWSSLGEKSFRDYERHFKTNDVREISYFGWFSNVLPGYPDTLSLKCRVCPQQGNQRPLIVLEASDHPLAVDARQGISSERAAELFEICIHGPGPAAPAGRA